MIVFSSPIRYTSVNEPTLTYLHPLSLPFISLQTVHSGLPFLVPPVAGWVQTIIWISQAHPIISQNLFNTLTSTTNSDT